MPAAIIVPPSSTTPVRCHGSPERTATASTTRLPDARKRSACSAGDPRQASAAAAANDSARHARSTVVAGVVR